MKRSEINRAILWAKALIQKNNICLPDYADWDLATWRANVSRIGNIERLMLGWDISDYGKNAFDTLGSVLYTIRNGLADDPSVGVPYCEKLILMKDGQRLPKHYHVCKSEDIINRANGVLQVFLWNADPKTGAQLDTPVHVFRDGLAHVYAPGEEILITPGNSISLTPYIAHIFGPKPGMGDLVVGEVSAVNDDVTDNYFLEDTTRFATIEEDEQPLRPLCNEYQALLRS